MTQKWNVLGEIAVGIFALKDIKEDEELSFDYQFDVYHTPFTRCLCGTSKCKGYLGLVPLEYTVEEWEQKIENLPCELCGRNVEDDDDDLLLCDVCNNGFHTFCLNPPLKEIPSGAWFCDNCKNKVSEDENTVEDHKEDAMVTENIGEKAEGVEFNTKTKKISSNKRRVRILSDTESESEVETDKDDYNNFYKFERELQKEAIKELKVDDKGDTEKANKVSTKEGKEKKVRHRQSSCQEEDMPKQTNLVTPIKNKRREYIEDVKKNCNNIFLEIFNNSEEIKCLKDKEF